MDLFKKIEAIGDDVQVPHHIWEDNRIKPVSKRLYRVILIHMRNAEGFNEDGEPFVHLGRQELAKETGISEASVYLAWNNLEELGLVHVYAYPGMGRENRITLLGEYFGIKPDGGGGGEEDPLKPSKDEKEYRDIKKGRFGGKKYWTGKYNKKLQSEDRRNEGRKKRMDEKKLQKLRKENGGSKRDKDIIAISRHYSSFVQELKNLPHHYSLSKTEPWNHKNWVQFERVYQLCKDNDWDSLFYIESQFDRAKNWGKGKYPFVNQLYSVNAQRYFKNWMKEKEEMYEHDRRMERFFRNNKKRKKKTHHATEKVRNGIRKQISYLKMYLYMEGRTKAEAKSIHIFDYWDSTNPALLYSIPWLREHIRALASDPEEYESNHKLPGIMEKFEMFDKSKSLRRTIFVETRKAYKEFGVPEETPNIQDIINRQIEKEEKEKREREWVLENFGTEYPAVAMVKVGAEEYERRKREAKLA